MIKQRTLSILIALILVLGLTYVQAGAFDAALARLDFSKRNGSASPLRTLDDIDRAIRFWQRRAAENPRDLFGYTSLGRNFIQKARYTGDVTNYTRAEEALRRALDIKPGYAPARDALTTALFAQHKFADALALAQTIYAEDPQAAPALATISDAHMALGDYAAAETALQALAQMGDSPAIESRLAFLAVIYGRPDEALRRMKRAATLSAEKGGYQEELAWYRFQLGELYFNSGRLRPAERQYRAALAVFPTSYLALAGLGKARAAQGDYEAAIDFYRRATAIIPQPDLLAALGDLYALSGQPEAAQRQYATVEYIGRLAEINRQVYNRQLALFYANHDLRLDEALALATRELEARQDIYGYDAAAWAYYKNGRLDEAQAMIERALKWGTRDAMLYYHAGMIAAARGERAAAARLLGEALAINPHFDPLQASLARRALAALEGRSANEPISFSGKSSAGVGPSPNITRIHK